MLRFNVDRNDNTVAGWAFNDENLDEVVEIFVECDGVIIDFFSANLYRKDIVAADLHATGLVGFSFDISAINFNGLTNNENIFVFAKYGNNCKDDFKNQYLARIDKDLFNSRFSENKIIVLDTGWLFLKNDSNNINKILTGEIVLSELDLISSATTFINREAIINLLGISYSVIVLPDKNVIFHNYLDFNLSEYRPVRVIQSLVKKFGLDILYPYEIFKENPEFYYCKTDTHINLNGMKLLYSLLNDRFPLFFIMDKLPNIVENTNFLGDLGVKLSNPENLTVSQFVFPHDDQNFRIIDHVKDAIENKKTLTGTEVFITNDNLENRLVVFGTSTSYYSLPLLSASFKSTYFKWGNNFDFEYILKNKPDCVVWLISERFLPVHENDIMQHLIQKK
jgi:hypothetical protein